MRPAAIPFAIGSQLIVAACLLSVTLFIALPLREPKGKPKPPVEGSRLAARGARGATAVRGRRVSTRRCVC